MVLFGKRLLNRGAARNVRGSIIKAALLSLALTGTGRLLVHGRPMMCAASVISQLLVIHMVIPLETSLHLSMGSQVCESTDFFH
jgi:hypothetical protein